jgi:hypothetical protein
MTTGRQKRKQDRARDERRFAFRAASRLAAGCVVASYPVLVAVLAIVLAVALPALRAVANEQVVVDWHTGLAISGYDPVAFFTDGKPLSGTADLELPYGGAVWRFANIGNRAAFAARPDVYMPQYGGYDPLGVARGLAVAGNPNVWVIADQRLFLFYDGDRRDRFAADPSRVIGAADRKWPDVMRAP